MKLFTETKLIEIDKGVKLEPITSELRESLRTLQHNVAFNYLLNKLKLQKSQVQTYLNEGFNLSEKELRYAQAGIYWLKWIETETNKLTSTPVPTARLPLDQEQIEFDRISANLQTIGQS